MPATSTLPIEARGFRLAVQIEQNHISRRQDFQGGWALGTYGAGSCPASAPEECDEDGNLTCCPSSLECHTEDDTAPFCCSEDDDQDGCQMTLENFPLCADPSWNMYQDPEDSNAYFCCEKGQVGVLPTSGSMGLCLSQQDAATLSDDRLATTASQIGSASENDGNGNSIDGGAIAGIVIGTIIGVALLLGALTAWYRRSRGKGQYRSPSHQERPAMAMRPSMLAHNTSPAGGPLSPAQLEGSSPYDTPAPLAMYNNRRSAPAGESPLPPIPYQQQYRGSQMSDLSSGGVMIPPGGAYYHQHLQRSASLNRADEIAAMTIPGRGPRGGYTSVTPYMAIPEMENTGRVELDASPAATQATTTTTATAPAPAGDASQPPPPTRGSERGFSDLAGDQG